MASDIPKRNKRINKCHSERSEESIENAIISETSSGMTREV